MTYQPALDGDADAGEVVWTWVAYEEDPTQGKDRPVVVIGRTGDQLAVVALTTKPHPERNDELEVGAGAWDAARRVSYAKVDRIIVVAPGAVRREGAVLDRSRFDRLIDRLSNDQPGGWSFEQRRESSRPATSARSPQESDGGGGPWY